MVNKINGVDKMNIRLLLSTKYGSGISKRHYVVHNEANYPIENLCKSNSLGWDQEKESDVNYPICKRCEKAFKKLSSV
jgi:hypothetical protein